MKTPRHYLISGIFLMACLIFVCHPALADDTCVFAVTADDMPPNILILLDNGAEMQHVAWHSGYDNSIDYTHRDQVDNDGDGETDEADEVDDPADPEVLWRLEDKYVLAQGRHDGYRRLSVPVVHRRTLVWQKGYFWLVVDELIGQGATKAANRVHLNPELGLVEVNHSTWKIKGSTSSLWLNAFGEQDHSIVRGQSEPVRVGWYSERFGELSSNNVIILDREDDLPFCYGYVISIGEPAETFFSTPQKEYYKIAVSYAQSFYELHLRVGGVTHYQ